MPKRKQAQSGIAGVFHVSSELERKGYTALPTLRNTAGFDILAASSDGRKYAVIQVKTSLNKVSFWLLGAKAVPDYMRENKRAFFVFVRYVGGAVPQFEAFVVRADEVHRQNTHHLRRRPNAWNSWTLPKDSKEKYQNRWDKLGLGSPRIG